MSEPIVEQVRSKYAAAAASGLSGEQAGVRAVAEAFGYSPEELASVPAEANMGLSCGNPTAFARLRPGETVVDLGCGDECPRVLAKRRLEWNIPDPKEMPPEPFREVRDLIEAKAKELLQSL